jgi:hypothetical protein
MSGITGLANHLWMFVCGIESRKYQKALLNIARTQERLLLSLLRNNAATEYGKKYGFARIQSVPRFQAQVPITEYSDYQPYLQRIAAGGQKILTVEPVLLFELSSGSTAASKLIPYTCRLKQEFVAGINPWVKNLYAHYPGLYRGKAYWSLTPVVQKPYDVAGDLAVGFEEDREYFGFMERYFLDQLFAVPGEVRYISEITTFRYVTLLFLIKERELALISVWNPTFFILLLKPFTEWRERLIEDLCSGTIHAPGELEEPLYRKLRQKLGCNVERARELRNILGPGQSREPVGGRSLYEQIWPHLQLISCWTEANAAMHLPELQKLFPSTAIQGKGLIATEGFVSFPFVGETGARPAFTSHFLEFEEVDAAGNRTGTIKLAHEIEAERTYTVILTTGGGFYRYRLGDLVRVAGYAGHCPRIRFVGKESMNSDLYGEKLNEFHVRQCLEKTLVHFGAKPLFSMVAPELDNETGYVLFLEFEPAARPAADELSGWAGFLETNLQENFHYRYCRRLGQLKPVRVFVINGLGLETYYRVCREFGQRDGDVKLYALHHRTGWVQQFDGELLKGE